MLAGVMTVAAAVSGCSASTPDAGNDPAQPELVGRTFLGNDVRVNDTPLRLVPGSTLRVSFEQETIGASAGCNSMSGSARWGSGTLIVDGQTLSMTEMGCEASLMKQDTWFADFLTSRPQILQAEASLTMTSGNTVIALTDEEVVVPDVDLTGTPWQLDSITTQGAVSSVPSGVQSTLELDDKGQLIALLGCNTGRGTYRATNDVLTIEPLATTKKACAPPASDVESEVVGFLTGDVSYSIDGKSLILTAQKVIGPGPTALVYRTP